MNKFSQTQISNIMSFAGLVVILANQAGFILEREQVAFVIAALWSIGWTCYNYYQRYSRGDLTLGGKRLTLQERQRPVVEDRV